MAGPLESKTMPRLSVPDRLADWKYVAARVARRYLVPERLLSYMPGYSVSQNELEPAEIVDKYVEYFDRLGLNPDGVRVLEIGVGATNSTGYELAARTGLCRWSGYDPFRRLDTDLDRRILDRVAARYGVSAAGLEQRVGRIDRLDSPAPESVDLVLSHCVLEHVKEPGELIERLTALLPAGGRMIHAVDYRDHYFRYPFHFLKFSEKTWDRWLDPGDLPRRRLFDHIETFQNIGLEVQVLETRRDPEAFARLEPWVRPAFKRGAPDDAAVWAVLVLSTRPTGKRKPS